MASGRTSYLNKYDREREISEVSESIIRSQDLEFHRTLLTVLVGNATGANALALVANSARKQVILESLAIG